MSVTSTITVTADLVGEGISAGPQSIGTIVNALSPAENEIAQLVAGNIALQYPLGFIVNYLLLDAGPLTAGQTLTVKGNSGDVGVNISSNLPSLIPISNVNPFVLVPLPGLDILVPQPVTQLWVQATSPGLMKIAWM